MASMRGPQIVIVGGGIGGVACAWSLAQRGATNVTLVERERLLGTHSTGRNAAILRTAALDPITERVALESAAFLRRPPSGFSDVPLVEPCGLIVASGPVGMDRGNDAEDPWQRLDAREDVERIDPATLDELAPHCRLDAERAWRFPLEGRLDNAALLDAFARGARQAGVRFLLGAGVRELTRDERGLTGVVLDDGSRLDAEHVVIAAGGWAAPLGRHVGSQVELRPTRRHLLVTETDERIDARWPVVWSDSDAFYCRPESGGLLYSACDQTDVDPDRLTDDADVLEAILTKAAALLPDFAELGAAHFWPGVRTLTFDGRFVVGPDPDVRGLQWVAGLGGHGMTCSAAVGRLAADLLLGLAAPDDITEALSPARFVTSPT